MQTTPPYIRVLKILHLALMAGQLLFIVIMFSSVYFQRINTFTLANISGEILIAMIIIAALAYLFANSLFNKKLAIIRETNLDVPQKLENYRSANVIRWALIEAPVILCCIFFFVTGNYYILLIAVIMIFLFYSTRTGTEKTINDLQISLSDLDNVSNVK